jgi:hypothetical protein
MKRLVILTLLTFVRVFVQSVCTSESSLQWSTANGRILHHDEEYNIRGLNWNGMETLCHVPHFLWKEHEDFFWSLFDEYGINSLRIPLSYWILDQPKNVYVNNLCTTANPHLNDMNVHTFLLHFLEKARAKNISVLFELHTIDHVISEFPWTSEVSSAQTTHAWTTFVEEYGWHPSILGWGLKNEPHGECSLDDFFAWCSHTIHAMEQQNCHHKLYFIAGVQTSASQTSEERETTPWGGTLADLNESALQGSWRERLVFEPHVYGPAVIHDASPDWNIWMKHFGFIRTRDWIWRHTPVVFTEIGGTLDGSDGVYYEIFLSFVNAYQMNDLYWWTIGESHDTGSIFDDSDHVLVKKMDYIQRFQTSPTF